MLFRESKKINVLGKEFYLTQLDTWYTKVERKEASLPNLRNKFTVNGNSQSLAIFELSGKLHSSGKYGSSRFFITKEPLVFFVLGKLKHSRPQYFLSGEYFLGELFSNGKNHRILLKLLSEELKKEIGINEIEEIKTIIRKEVIWNYPDNWEV